jgi:hypothetical protein
VVDLRHDERLSGLPSLKGFGKAASVPKVSKGAMNGTTHVGRMLPGNSTEDANGGVGTIELGMGILEANIRGCDWK